MGVGRGERLTSRHCSRAATAAAAGSGLRLGTAPPRNAAIPRRRAHPARPASESRSRCARRSCAPQPTCPSADTCGSGGVRAVGQEAGGRRQAAVLLGPAGPQRSVHPRAAHAAARRRRGRGRPCAAQPRRSHLNRTICATGSWHLEVKNASSSPSASASVRITRRATPSRRPNAASMSARQPAWKGGAGGRGAAGGGSGSNGMANQQAAAAQQRQQRRTRQLALCRPRIWAVHG